VIGWRLHWERSPRRPKRYPTGKFRFDAPAGQYKVTYVNEDRYATFAEVYGNQQGIPPTDRTRILSRVTVGRELKLLTIDEAEVQKAFALDLNISAVTDYPQTQAWSPAWHTWYPDVDGIRYVGRHAVKKLNYCFFLDRCADALAFKREGVLHDLDDVVAHACELYSLDNRLGDPIAGW
jgi:RES domain